MGRGNTALWEPELAAHVLVGVEMPRWTISARTTCIVRVARRSCCARSRPRNVTRVRNDKADFYGRDYYGKYVTDLGYPDLASRARTDLPERCLHWLRAILKYRLPPAKALELGSAHGGLVALLRWAGFNARGLELSPSIVKFARQTFGVPTLLGPVEDQKIAPRSLNVVALMDVLEHLPDPVATTKRLFDLLKPGGVIVIQTPRYAEGLTLDELAARHDRFVEQLKPREHLFLFSQKSVRKLLRRHGAEHVAFEPAIFAHYDMFLVASRRPLKTVKRARIAPALTKTPSARMIQCLLDAGDRLDQFEAQFQQSEADRAARLEVIQRQGRRTVELEAEIHRSIEETRKYSAHVQQLEAAQAKLTKQLEISEADRAARLEVIQQQGRRTVELEAEIHHCGGDQQILRPRAATGGSTGQTDEATGDFGGRPRRPARSDPAARSPRHRVGG